MGRDSAGKAGRIASGTNRLGNKLLVKAVDEEDAAGKKLRNGTDNVGLRTGKGSKLAETVLVTGGAGFIGRAVTTELLRRGNRVRVLDSLIEQVHGDRERPEDFPEDAELVVGDIRNKDVVTRALQGIDSVVHLAAEVGVGQSMYAVERYTSVNDVGTAVLFEKLIDDPVRRVVTASSMSIYGEGLYRDPDGGLIQEAKRQARTEGQTYGQRIIRREEKRDVHGTGFHPGVPASRRGGARGDIGSARGRFAGRAERPPQAMVEPAGSDAPGPVRPGRWVGAGGQRLEGSRDPATHRWEGAGWPENVKHGKRSGSGGESKHGEAGRRVRRPRRGTGGLDAGRTAPYL